MWADIFFVWLFASAAAQKIQYSRQTIPDPVADVMQLIADVDGSHHLLCFTAKKKPLLYIIDASLQGVTEHEIDVRLKENCDLRVVPFRKDYLLYLHVPGTSTHQLFRVNSKGEAADVSHLFSAPADSLWNRSTATFQFISNGDRPKLLALTYYDALKKTGCRIVSFDADLKVASVNTVFFPFDQNWESLLQLQLLDQNLFVLTAEQREERGAVLNMRNVQLSTGQTMLKAYTNEHHLFAEAAFQYNQADSSILLYATIRETLSSTRMQRNIFLARLDQSLHETTPAILLRSQFRSDIAANFLVPAGKGNQWFSVSNGTRLPISGVTRTSSTNPRSINLNPPYRARSDHKTEANVPAGVRFTELNEQLKPAQDSVVANKGDVYDVQPRPFMQFRLQDKACLLLIENFSSKKHGLLLFTADEKNGWSTKNISVFERYEYLLLHLQTIGRESFILPYTFKNEIGLVKVSITE